ncbi:MAG: RHS repeat domain-containing protein [Moheibacter sp.]
MAAILTAMTLFGQIGGINDPFRDLIPNTPNAAEMTQYGKLEIGEYTGTMQHSIPLYEINYKGIRIPITLNYRSNGVNIDKHESSVGIDWSLNAGGVITRTIMDVADEMAGNNDTQDFPQPPYTYGHNQKNDFFSSVAGSDTYDMQSDIFTFNIMGYSGKFYLQNALNTTPEAIMIDPSPVKIFILEGFGNFNNQGSDIKIILPNGLICWFGGPEAYDNTDSRSVRGGNPQPFTLGGKNAFYLTKIESPTGEELNLKYNWNGFNEKYTGISQSVSAMYDINLGLYAKAPLDGRTDPVMFKTMGHESYIKSIEWNYNKIEFEYDQKLLNEIIIKHKDQPKTKFLFDYSEMGTDDEYDNDCSYCHPLGYNKRYFLKELKKVNFTDPSQSEIFQFEYFDPQRLPSRFSFARDYWGYFNGEKNDYLVPSDVSRFNQGDYASVGSEHFPYNKIQGVFSEIGGNRETNPDYAVFGLLKKIYYPTKGWTEIEYEANSYYGEVVIPGEKTRVELAVFKDDITHNTVTDSKIITLPTNQTISLLPSVTTIEPPYCELEETGHEIATLKITDEGNNSIVFINTYHPNSPSEYFNGLANHTYNFTLSTYSPCTSSTLIFDYESSPSTTIQQNIPFGGMRVKGIKNKDSDGNTLTREEYFYGDLDCLECSNAVYEFPKPEISFYALYTNLEDNHSKATVTLGSSSLNSLYFSNSLPIAYPIVSKRIYDSQNKNTGLLVHNYDIVLDQTPIIYLGGDLLPGTSYTNGFGNGNLLNEKAYNDELNLIYEKEYYYKFDESFDNSKEAYNLTVIGIISQSSQPPFDQGGSADPIGYSVNKYFIRSKRQFMDYTIEKNYTDNGVLETRTDYYYDGANKLLKSMETITDSNGKTFETTFSYPPDLIGVEQSSYMQQLTDANRIAKPVITKTTKGDKHYIEKHLKYGQNQSTGNLLLPVELHTKKGFNSININNTDDRKLTYTKYDTGGNLLEYLTEDGSPVSLIWGYDNQYPIAKIEGVAYDNLPEQKVTALQNLSDSGQLSAQSFYDLINSVDGMVTAYTYEPLVGVKTITQPNGTTAYYEYDDFGRLISVKDTDGNVLKEVQYNFKQ